jgi:5'(3')-deoxyribonucleotidase
MEGSLKMNKIIAIDCDLVLARSDAAWVTWLANVTNSFGTYLDAKTPLDYNLSNYFKGVLGDVDPLDFWRHEGTYDWVEPVQYSQDALYCLKKAGFTIIVVSHIKGNTNKSKWQFLKRNFGSDIDGYLATQEKQFVRADYFIDDRNSHLNRQSGDVTCIRLDTPYTQDEKAERDIIVAEDWNEVIKTIFEREGID